MIALGNRTILDAGQTVAFGGKNFKVQGLYFLENMEKSGNLNSYGKLMEKSGK
jgi:hypothetical protein